MNKQITLLLSLIFFYSAHAMEPFGDTIAEVAVYLQKPEHYLKDFGGRIKIVSKWINDTDKRPTRIKHFIEYFTPKLKELNKTLTQEEKIIFAGGIIPAYDILRKEEEKK